jgi:hypothetical protein
MAVLLEKLQECLAQLVAGHLFHGYQIIARAGGLLRRNLADVVMIAVV